MTAADCAIRPFDAADLAALQRIRQAAFAPVFRSFREIAGEEIYALALHNADAEQAAHLEALCRPGPDHRVFVAEAAGEIAGFAAINLDRQKRVGELGLNAVDPAHQGKGVGAALHAAALAVMKEAGMQVATVGVGGDASHAPARRAYEKAGFGAGIPSLWLYRKL